MRFLLLFAMLGGCMQKVAADEFTLPDDHRYEFPFTVKQKARLSGDYSAGNTELQISLVTESTYEWWLDQTADWPKPLLYWDYKTDIARSGKIDVSVDPG